MASPFDRPADRRLHIQYRPCGLECRLRAGCLHRAFCDIDTWHIDRLCQDGARQRRNRGALVLRSAGDAVTGRSVTDEQYGRFLIEVFEEWVRRDVGKVYVQMFDVALANWVGAPSGLCVHSETCGLALALEHTGDLYSCDHFVEPRHRLGNIRETHMLELVASQRQRRFGQDKRDTLPTYCLECDVRFACHGGCPKDRFIRTPDGEPGLNYLCAGYKAFFHHVDEPMRIMAGLLAQDRAPAEIVQLYAAADARRGRNDRCSCGSGRKWKTCHGRSSANRVLPLG